MAKAKGKSAKKKMAKKKMAKKKSVEKKASKKRGVKSKGAKKVAKKAKEPEGTNASSASLFEKLKIHFENVVVPYLKKHGLYDDDDAQELSPSEPIEKGIPTLTPGVFVTATPLITQRFAFAGSWTNAVAGQEWLSVSDMEKLAKDDRIMKSIRSQQEYWDESAPMKFPFDRISLFSIDREDPSSRTFLVWKTEGAEPEVWSYSGQEESKYKDLKAYVAWALKTK